MTKDERALVMLEGRALLFTGETPGRRLSRAEHSTDHGEDRGRDGFGEWLKMVLIFYLMAFGYQLLPR